MHDELSKDHQVEPKRCIVLLVEQLVLIQLNEMPIFHHEFDCLRGDLPEEVMILHEVDNRHRDDLLLVNPLFLVVSETLM